MAASSEGSGAPGGAVHGRRAASRAGCHGGGDGRGRETRGIHVGVMIDTAAWTKCCTGWRYAVGERAGKKTVDPSDRPVICFVGSVFGHMRCGAGCLSFLGGGGDVGVSCSWRRSVRDGGIRLSGIAEAFDVIHG